jgi:Fe-S-cluster containining protein
MLIGGKHVEDLTIVDLHNFMDEMESEVGKNPVSKCGTRTPCSGCCYLNVKVFRDEAKRLLEYLPIDKGIDYLKRVTTRDDDDRMRQRRPCVFLKDDKCSVYSVRPIICRSYSVKSHPKHCYEFKKGLTKVKPMQSPAMMHLLSLWWKANPKQQPKLMEEHLLDLLIGQEEDEGRNPVKEVQEGRRE